MMLAVTDSDHDDVDYETSFHYFKKEDHGKRL